MRLLAAIVASPADLLVSQGATVTPTKSTAPKSLIAWLTDPPNRLRRWICCLAILLLRPDRAIQLVGTAVVFNGLANDPVQPFPPPQIFPDVPKLCGRQPVAMRNGLLEFSGFPDSKYG
jgi:hypothetical protein